MPVASYFKRPQDTTWTRIDALLGLPVDALTHVTAIEALMIASWQLDVTVPSSQQIIHEIYKFIGIPLTVGFNEFQTKHIAYTLLGPTIDPIDEIIANHHMRIHQWAPGLLQLNPSI